MKFMEKMRIIDTVEFRRIRPESMYKDPSEYTIDDLDMSPEGLILETNNHPSIIQRILMFFGLYKCAGDAMMNSGLQYITTCIHDYYNYISVGTSSSLPDDYTRSDLVTPVLTRALATKGYDTTFIENDTAVMTGIFTPSGAYTIVETGIHPLVTGGDMGARQTTCNIPTTSGVPFGIIWRICVARG